PLWLETHAEEAEAEVVGDGLDLEQVAADLAAGLVDGTQLGAGQFELAGGFEGDRGAVAAGQGDHAPVLLHRIPAEAHQALEQGFDAALAVEFGRAQVVEAETELLVLGTDAPVVAGALAGGDVLDQFPAIGDRGFGNVAGTRHSAIVVPGHGGLPASAGRSRGKGGAPGRRLKTLWRRPGAPPFPLRSAATRSLRLLVAGHAVPRPARSARLKRSRR